MLKPRKILAFLSLFLIVSCDPAIEDVEIYVGDSQTASIVRQNSEPIQCVDPQIDDYFCVSSEDFGKILSYIKECSE